MKTKRLDISRIIISDDRVFWLLTRPRKDGATTRQIGTIQSGRIVLN